ncbi:hypothetical protein PI125_g2340 [Phytophthora idaei]|nr:hypothetical protein PI125_g2340 [Phytophthora idaei]
MWARRSTRRVVSISARIAAIPSGVLSTAGVLALTTAKASDHVITIVLRVVPTGLVIVTPFPFRLIGTRRTPVEVFLSRVDCYPMISAFFFTGLSVISTSIPVGFSTSTLTLSFVISTAHGNESVTLLLALLT